MSECPSAATILGAEVRVSVLDPLRIRPLLNWPIAHLACWEIIPE
jgi:hypothetical protein